MEPIENTALSSKEIIVRYGLVSGGILVAYTAALYFIDPKMLFGGLAYIGFLLALVICVLAAVKRKKVNGGFITYGEAVVTSVITFSIGQAMSTVFTILLYLAIDPGLITTMKNVQMESVDTYLAKGILTKAQYNDSINRIRDINSNSILTYGIAGFFIVVVIATIIFLLTSIAVKKDSPFKNNSI
jgi:hypothetical protein